MSMYNEQSESNGKYLIEIKTVQSSIIKTLIESLKEILPDTNIEFDQNGIKVLTMDPTHTVLVHVNLNSKNFEHYHCKNKQIIGVNMVNLFKLIKTMSSSDSLCLYIESQDPNHLGIQISNGEKNSITNFKLSLLDLNEEAIQVPPAQFTSVITMPSGDFQKVCRDMYNLSDTIQIKSIRGQLILDCKGDFANQETIMGESVTNGVNFIHKHDEPGLIQGFFSLKHLVLFTKCTNLCSSIQLFLKNDYPLIICYQVGSLGEIRLCLAPKADE